MRPISVCGAAIFAALFATIPARADRPAATGFVQCTTSSGYITNSVSCSTGTESGLVTRKRRLRGVTLGSEEAP